jgi:hypothetical protein
MEIEIKSSYYSNSDLTSALPKRVAKTIIEVSNLYDEYKVGVTNFKSDASQFFDGGKRNTDVFLNNISARLNTDLYLQRFKKKSKCEWCRLDGKRKYPPTHKAHIIKDEHCIGKLLPLKGNAANIIELCSSHHDMLDGRLGPTRKLTNKEKKRIKDLAKHKSEENASIIKDANKDIKTMKLLLKKFEQYKNKREQEDELRFHKMSVFTKSWLEKTKAAVK